MRPLLLSLLSILLAAAPQREARGEEAAGVRAPAAAAPRPPRIELLAGLGLSAGGSRWSGDGLGYGGLLLGVRFFRAVALFGDVRLGYAGVDQRLLTFLSIGVQGGFPIRGRLAPYARLAFVHQHEESLAAVADNLGGALLGIGAGIRHRAGLQAAVGCDFTVFRGRRGEVVLGPTVMLAYLGYSSGPDLYGTAGLQVGGNVHLF